MKKAKTDTSFEESHEPIQQNRAWLGWREWEKFFSRKMFVLQERMYPSEPNLTFN